MRHQAPGTRCTRDLHRPQSNPSASALERMFPVHSPKIERIEVAARGDVRRQSSPPARSRGRRARVREAATPVPSRPSMGSARPRADGRPPTTAAPPPRRTVIMDSPGTSTPETTSRLRGRPWRGAPQPGMRRGNLRRRPGAGHGSEGSGVRPSPEAPDPAGMGEPMARSIPPPDAPRWTAELRRSRWRADAAAAPDR